MLPFLKPKKMASVIMASRKPDGSAAPDKKEDEKAPESISAAESLISAVHSKDAEAVAKALDAYHAHLGTGVKDE